MEREWNMLSDEQQLVLAREALRRAAETIPKAVEPSRATPHACLSSASGA
jgi:hypothetical protein